MGIEEEPWSAPRARGPVDARVIVPGSKSQTNRALVLGALATGPSRLVAPLHARDTLLMKAALESLGARFTDVIDHGEGTSDWSVEPHPLRGPARIDCGLAGTVMRFVPILAALAKGDVRFDGDPRARVRPMTTTIESLRSLGVRVSDDGRGALPFTVHGEGSVRGGVVALDATASSQFVSALLLAGSSFDDGLTIRHRGGAIPSMPHLDMTVAMLRASGVDVVVDGNVLGSREWAVAPGPVHGREWQIEPDLSNSAPFLAAAMVTGGRTEIPHWPQVTDQAGDRLRELLTAMGGTVERDGEDLTVTGPAALLGLDADLHDVGELTPVIAALCALAQSTSQLRGIAHLRGHETDRLAAIAREITALGGDVRETEDGLVINPRVLHGGLVHTYDDHRIATAAAVLGLAVPDVRVENVGTTSKTLPNFVVLWESMLGMVPEGAVS